MANLKAVLVWLLLLSGIFTLVELGLFADKLRRLDIQTLNHTLTGVQNTVNDLNAVVLITRGTLTNLDLMMGRIEDSSKSWQATAEHEMQYWQKLQGKTLETFDKVNIVADSAAAFLQNTDASLNADQVGVLKQLAAVIGKTGATVEQTTKDLEELGKKMGVNLDDLHAILSDPAWKESLKEIQSTMQHTDGMMAHAETAMGHVEYYLSPKKASLWLRLIQIFVPKFNIQLN
jgi:hypothetical protein